MPSKQGELGMRTLWLLRHAKSAWDDPTLADHDRPLNRRGRLAAPQIAQVLAAQTPLPQCVLCSTAVRTRATWDLIAPAFPAIPVEYRADLYHAEPLTLRLYLQRVPQSITSVLLIGHNPGLEEWLTELTGAREPLPTAALVQITVPLTCWSELTTTTGCQLERIWRPRDLPEPLPG